MSPEVLIIATDSPAHARRWEEKLAQPGRTVIGTVEDWPAGNGLGTLHAFREANQRIDLFSALESGKRVAIYHTAGEGTRLAPLPACEGNCKPAVELPAAEPLCMLEAVIKQTAPLAFPGRLGVFWSDQLFLSEKVPEPTHPIAIFSKHLPTFDAQIWKELNLDQYGLLYLDGKGNAQQFEKASFEKAKSLINEGILSVDGGISISLGSFSLAPSVVKALLDEFGKEIDEKGKRDTDPDFWMPLSLGDSERMNQWKARHFPTTSHLIGACEMGEGHWWDYGRLTTYFENALSLLRQDKTGEAMRRFFGITSPLINCEIGGGTIENSLCINVKADHVDIRNSVLIHVSAPSITAENGLLYKVEEENPIDLPKFGVRAGNSHSTLALNIDFELNSSR